MSERKTEQTRIEAWQQAFVHANGSEAPVVDYERGWYYVDGRGNPFGLKWRASQIEAATARLLARPLPHSKEGGKP